MSGADATAVYAPILPLCMISKPALYSLTALTAAALLLFVLLTHTDDASAQQSNAATPTPTPPLDSRPQPTERTPPLGNLDSMLSQLAARVQDGHATARAAASQAPIHAADSVAVTFYLDGDDAPLLAFLRANGGDPRNVGDDYVEAYAPLDLLVQASEQPNVIRVQAIISPQPNRGRVVSQGVAAHNVDAWHSNNYTGEGVKVGVIDIGFEGFSDLMESESPDNGESPSELPSKVRARCYAAVGVFNSNIENCEINGSHGAAVSETLLDVAPDAGLYIANPQTKGDLRATVNWMISEGVDVINQSRSWHWDGPGDGASPYSDSPLKSVDAAVSGGAIWTNSAGNEAQSAWFGAFSDPNSNRWLNFNNGAAGDEFNEVYIEAGEEFTAQLRWAGSWRGAETDLDLMLDDPSGETVASSENVQRGRIGDAPFEFISYTPAVSGIYYLGVVRWSEDTPEWAQLQVFSGEKPKFHTAARSIGSPAESANPGMLAVGAAHHADVNAIEAYSSRGPTLDGRTKPDIVGVDCGAVAVSTYAVRTRADGQPCGFDGTSQASAHIAGMAALVRERFHDHTPAQIADYLKSNAEPRGIVPNNAWGYGFAKMPAITASPTPTATPEPTPTHTPTVTPTPTATPIGGARLNDLESDIGALGQLIADLLGLITALNNRIATLENATATPTATPITTPTQPSNCIRKIYLGWLTGIWNNTCLSNKTPPGAQPGIRYARFYTFTLDAPADVTVSITASDAGNTYLYLLAGAGMDGAVLHKHETQIAERLPAGDYTIEATTYSPQSGRNFSLTLDIAP